MGTEQEQELSPESLAKYEENLSVIKQQRRSFFDAGSALKEIRDLRLYREAYNNWEDFCRREADMTKSHTDRLISASIVMDILRGNSITTPLGVILPETETQARPLTRLKETPSKVCEAWRLVLDTSYQTREKITADFVELVVSRYLGPEKKTQEEEDLEFIEAEKDRCSDKFSGKFWDIYKNIQDEIDNGYPGTSQYAMLYHFEAIVTLIKNGETTSEAEFRQILSKSLNKKEAKRLGKIIPLEGKRKNNQ